MKHKGSRVESHQHVILSAVSAARAVCPDSIAVVTDPQTQEGERAIGIFITTPDHCVYDGLEIPIRTGRINTDHNVGMIIGLSNVVTSTLSGPWIRIQFTPTTATSTSLTIYSLFLDDLISGSTVKLTSGGSAWRVVAQCGSSLQAKGGFQDRSRCGLSESGDLSGFSLLDNSVSSRYLEVNPTYLDMVSLPAAGVLAAHQGGQE